MPSELGEKDCFQHQLSLNGVLAGVWESSEDGSESRFEDPHELGARPGIFGRPRVRAADCGAQPCLSAHRPRVR